jgi:heat-inducible transcriptional repressor
MSLTERQAQILKVIIQEYINTAQPVGSVTLEKKYSLGVSPATIRNEMSALTKSGFLHQPHTSAGRVPTPMALKYYVRELLKEEELSVAEEVAVKEKVWDHRFDADRFLKEITRTLAQRTKALAVACTKSGSLYHAGYSHILACPEFYDIDVTRAVLNTIDELNQIQALFSKALGDDPVHILIGDDFDNEFFQQLGLIFTNFSASENFSGSLGIIGPNRFDYSSIIPTVRYFGQLISEISQNW